MMPLFWKHNDHPIVAEESTCPIPQLSFCGPNSKTSDSEQGYAPVQGPRRDSVPQFMGCNNENPGQQNEHSTKVKLNLGRDTVGAFGYRSEINGAYEKHQVIGDRQ